MHFSPFFFVAPDPPIVFIPSAAVKPFFSFLFFVRQGALCSRQQGSKTASEAEQLGNEKGARDETGGGRRLE